MLKKGITVALLSYKEAENLKELLPQIMDSKVIDTVVQFIIKSN